MGLFPKEENLWWSKKRDKPPRAAFLVPQHLYAHLALKLNRDPICLTLLISDSVTEWGLPRIRALTTGFRKGEERDFF